LGRLDNKVAIITAAGSGMGQASARLFAQEGAKVVVADIDPSKGQGTVKMIKEARGEATFIKADVTKIADMERMVKTTVDTYGKLNILFNHAGLPCAFKLDVSEDEWNHCLDANAKGAFFATKFAVAEMRKAGSSSIIFTSSVAGVVGSAFSPIYSLAKGGIVNLTRALALLLAPDNIRVNCICPGGVDTPMTPKFAALPGTPPEEIEAKRQQFLKSIPLGRRAVPEEVAYAALFLASDESSFITGVTLPVDGGLLAR